MTKKKKVTKQLVYELTVTREKGHNCVKNVLDVIWPSGKCFPLLEIKYQKFRVNIFCNNLKLKIQMRNCQLLFSVMMTNRYVYH